MLVRCTKCENLIDLHTNTAIISFILGNPIKCDSCKQDIYYKEKEK